MRGGRGKGGGTWAASGSQITWLWGGGRRVLDSVERGRVGGWSGAYHVRA